MKIAVHTFYFANDTFYIWLLAVLTGLFFARSFVELTSTFDSDKTQ